MMQDYTKLNVWQKAHALTLSIYNITTVFPKSEAFGITSQMRRAAFSIPANVAEGCGRGTNRELRQFLYIAVGSASELDYYLLLARDLGILPPKQFPVLKARITEVRRMLAGLIESINTAASQTSN
ncbi:MAG TPA: four helix bundle protein [Candidatus Sulfotelmatobacter sp.]|nr:four helix bundle protein [Candidatus Sulfotelmatobacter sp.]